MSRTHTLQLIQSPAILVIPPARILFAIRFQRIKQFHIEVLTRGADEAFAEGVKMLQTDEGRVQPLISTLNYFITGNINKAQGE